MFSNFEEWADQTNLLLSRYGTMPTIISYKDWDRWACAVLMFPQISGQNPPAPSRYSDWRSWARDFNLTVNLPAQ
jgi:hypothetical protein